MKKAFISKVIGTALLGAMAITMVPATSVEAYGFQQGSPTSEFLNKRAQGSLSNGGIVVAPFAPHTVSQQSVNPRFAALGLPATYDLRSRNRLTELRDQGQNGSCWTFAAYGSTESVLKTQGITADYAEKNMRNLHGFDFLPTQGGNLFMSTAYMARWDGPVNESDDPYDDYDFTSSRFRKQRELKQMMILPSVDAPGGMDAIKEAVMNYGGVQTAFYSNTNYENPRTKDYYFYGTANSNHAVTIVGWDDNYSKDRFAGGPRRNGAWLVRNSWGQNWGDKGGYFYVSYEDRNFAKGFVNAVYFTQANGTSDNIYQHDPLGMTNDTGFLNETAYASNVFTASNKGQNINQVGLYLTADNASYEIYAIDNYKGTADLSKGVKIGSGSSRYAGYIVEKTNNFKVTPGAKFAIVVKYTTPGYSRPIPVETPIAKYSSKARATSGQSYISADGKNWTDLVTKSANTNVCIKAFTKDGAAAPTEQIKVTGVELEKSALTIKVGENAKVNATVAPQNATDKSVSYTSSNNRVATVAEDGTVTAVAKGTADITVKTNDGNFTKVCKITVTEDAAPTPNPTDGITVTVTPTRTSFYQGQTAAVRVEAKDADGNPLRYATVKVTLTKPDGSSVSRISTTNSYGQYTYTMYTRYSDKGTYNVSVEVTSQNETARGTGSFEVR